MLPIDYTSAHTFFFFTILIPPAHAVSRNQKTGFTSYLYFSCPIWFIFINRYFYLYVPGDMTCKVYAYIHEKAGAECGTEVRAPMNAFSYQGRGHSDGMDYWSVIPSSVHQDTTSLSGYETYRLLLNTNMQIASCQAL
jgi:hypothetical protein